MNYYAFVDPSGGSADSFTLAVAHAEKRFILDGVWERKPPFSPTSVTEEFAAILKQYGVRKVTGDRYGGEFPRELFRTHGVGYEPSAKTRSEIYIEFLSLLNSGRVELRSMRGCWRNWRGWSVAWRAAVERSWITSGAITMIWLTRALAQFV